ncbi:PcfJ domain-containing protein [Salmonella enterica]|nr:PcfJ domain-containing protein [Salmonella enterica]
MQTDINSLTCSRCELSLHDLFLACRDAGVFRLVKKDEDNKFIIITICGVFRIRKNKISGKVTMWVFCNTWRERNSLPVFIPLFWSNSDSFLMNDWIEKAIIQVLDNLIDVGYKISGDIHLFRVRVYKKVSSRFVVSFYPGEVLYTYQCDELCSPLGVTSFSVPESKGGKYHVHGFKNIYGAVVNVVIKRVWKIINKETRTVASKLLSKHIWLMVDKKLFSMYGRACFCSLINDSLINTGFEKYLGFTRKTEVSSGLDFEGLWPLVGKLYDLKGNSKFLLTGKTRELYDLLQFPCDVTYGDIKALRHVSVSLVSIMKRSFLWKEDRSPFFVAIRLLRNPLIRRYPVEVCCRLLDFLGRQKFTTAQIYGVYRICDKWLEYYRDMYKNIGFRRQKNRWEMEVNHLTHTIEWYMYTNPEINKNQQWPSFWRLAEDWIHNINVNENYNFRAEGKIADKWSGTGVNWKNTFSGVKEITHLEELRIEGQEMEHCVAIYASDCATGCYLVFSVNDGDDRVTLGLSRSNDDITYRFDQIRGARNSAVSQKMMIKGKMILKRVNESIIKK